MSFPRWVKSFVVLHNLGAKNDVVQPVKTSKPRKCEETKCDEPQNRQLLQHLIEKLCCKQGILRYQVLLDDVGRMLKKDSHHHDSKSKEHTRNATQLVMMGKLLFFKVRAILRKRQRVSVIVFHNALGVAGTVPVSEFRHIPVTVVAVVMSGIAGFVARGASVMTGNAVSVTRSSAVLTGGASVMTLAAPTMVGTTIIMARTAPTMAGTAIVCARTGLTVL
mmetsp:Transcript_68738/g.157663  ORF Transcript_68738/g.157663 Transcript_68738/m.157663 type:complete len:221 (-) Transcript_68738:388-1050(-)